MYVHSVKSVVLHQKASQNRLVQFRQNHSRFHKIESFESKQKKDPKNKKPRSPQMRQSRKPRKMGHFLVHRMGTRKSPLSYTNYPSYLNYVEKMCTEFGKLNQFDLNTPLSSIFQEYKGKLIYEDLMHLVKCNLYRLICGSYICPSLSKDEATFSANDFKDIGVKDHVLDPSRAKKIDDQLPL